MRFTRRTFLFSAFGVAAVGGGGAPVSYTLNSGEGMVTRIVRRRLPDLNMAEEELAEFARDFVAHDVTTPTHLLAMLRITSPIVLSDSLSVFVPQKALDMAERYERKVLTKFFLSTDFFDPARQKDGPVVYITFADPWEAICANPLANTAL